MEPAPDRRCAVCGVALNADADPRRRYCSTRCRVVAHRQRVKEPRLRLVEPELVTQRGDLDEDEQLQAVLVGAVLRAARTDWRAARWLLETRWPERFGPRA